MLVRDATASDARRIAEIHVDSWRSAYRGIMPDSVLDGLSVDERYGFWSTQLAGSVRQTLVATDQQQIVGWAGFGPCREADPPGLAEVYGIYLDPSYSRRGFGKALWSEVCRRLVEQGYDQKVVWVLAANISARRFYEAMGGRVDPGVEKVLLREGTQLPEMRYRCPCR